MKKIKTFIIANIILILSSSVNALETQTWTHMDPGLWDKPIAVITFQSNFYLSAEQTQAGDNRLLWTSSDGLNWISITDTNIQGIVFQSFTEGGGYLYGFGVANPASPERKAFRTLNGTSWEHLGDFGNGEWTDSELYTNPQTNETWLFVTGTGKKLWRISNIDGVPSFSPLIIPEFIQHHTITGNQLLLAAHKGYLHLAVDFKTCCDTLIKRKFTRTMDGLSWEHYSNGETSQVNSELDMGFGLVSDGEYVRHNRFRTTGDSPISENPWGYEDNFFCGNGFKTPVVIGNRFHYYVAGLLVSNLDSILCAFENGQYKEVATGLPSYGHERRAHYNGIAETADISLMLVSQNLLRMKRGMDSVDFAPFVFNPLTLGQRQGTVLGWSVSFSFEEQINNLRVINLGTAQHGTDIERVELYKRLNDPRLVEPKVLLAELNPEPGSKSWRTPPDFQFSLEEGDVFSLTVDILPHARDGKTIQFSIPSTNGFGWKINQTLQMGLTSPEPQTIIGVRAAANSPLSLDEAIIFPHPAVRGPVHFLYNLDSMSDVTIKIFNPLGDLVSEIQESGKPADPRTKTIWQASTVGPGLYFAHFDIRPVNGNKRQFSKEIVIQK